MIRPLCVSRLLGIGMLIISAITAKAQADQKPVIYFKQAISADSLVLEPIDQGAANMKSASVGRLTRVFLQFNSIPDSRKKQILKARGIELLDYIPDNTFLANVSGKWSASALQDVGIRATIPLKPAFRKATISEVYTQKNNSGKYHVAIAPGTDSAQARNAILALFQSKTALTSAPVFLNNRLLEIGIDAKQADLLLDLPFVLYVMPAPKMMVLNSVATDNLNAAIVQQGINGVPALLGKGIVMGMGDEGRADHIDNGYDEEGQDYNSGYHSTHVAGTMIGAGIIDPYRKGFAPKSTLLVDFFNTIIYRSPAYYQQNRMVLTNNSYGAGSYCVPYSGEYSGYCGQADQQLLDYPNLMHVFAAGNSGDLQCGAYPMGYRSIDNSFQAAKNVLTVGGTSHDGLTNKFSRGPVNDGRLKPEISGIGNAMISTITGNGYGSNQGTSMSAPQVTGALALLYERYRQLNGDLDPPGDLAKAIICNTATDIGTKGVDFSTGFGWVNLKKAIEVVTQKSYQSGTVEQNGEQVFEINLDKEVFNFKVMLYWHDQPSSYYTLKNLVNDLDLTVESPDGAVYDPMVLDTSAAGVTRPAFMGKDHLNNIEQVVIDHAFPGRYRFRIKGYKVPMGPQVFKVVYNWDEPGLKLIQPVGGEQWKPNQLRGIHWEDAGHDGDGYKFAYSLDNGSSWTDLPGLTGTYNRVDWTIPNIQGTEARIKITNTTTGNSSISNPFVILPEISFSISSPCSSELLVNWSKPAGIDSVAVLLYNKGTYVEQGITTDSNFTISGLRNGPGYWITLQPLVNGKAGERSIGQQIFTSNIICTPSGAPGDLQLNAIQLPPAGREGTSTAQAGPIPVQVQLENKGNTVIGDTVFLDLLKEGIFWGKDTLVRNFSAGEKFSWTTNYNFPAVPGTTVKIGAEITVAGDTNGTNNRKDSSWRYLLNPSITLPYSDDFAGIIDSVYAGKVVTGISGAEAWDFSTISASISLNTSQQKGFLSHSKILQQNFDLTGIFNLSASSLTDNVRMDIHIPGLAEMEGAIYIRGSEVSTWLLLPLTDPISGLETTRNMNISGLLSKYNQAFTSSFQVRITGTTSSYLQEMEMLKSIRFYTSSSDLALIDLNYTKARVTDGDSMHIVLSAFNKKLTTNGAFKIALKTPDGQVQTVQVDSLAANKIAYAAFTINVKDWPGAVSPIVAWVNDPADDFPDDDSLQAILGYYRKISHYPYLQGFEQGDAGWGKTYLYDLSTQLTESIAPFKAANGSVFWGTRRVNYSNELAYPVSAGYLVSPMFEVSALQKPWISMSVNKQFCDGMDSVVMQYSVDTGRTWKTINTTTTSTNWYDQPALGSWKACGNDYWQVVSTALPTTNKGVIVRILLVGANALADEFPRLPGGLLVDDVHVFDLIHPLFAGTEANTGIAQEPEGIGNSWLKDNNIIAAATTVGNNLSLIGGQTNSNYQGNRVMPKSWVFNGKNTANQDSKLRLYFTHSEIMAWLNTVSCDTCLQKRSAYDLAVYRYSGPNALINETSGDNTPGFEEIWPAESFDLIPYESGYYAEIPTSAYGEFYIGLDDKGSGLYFSAERQPDADIVLLNWSLNKVTGLTRFEVERAPRHDGELVFTQIGNVPTTTDTVYRFRDIRLQTPGSWLYRLKLIYANGDIRYSPIRTISFEKSILAKLYPNPSPDGRVSLLLENAEGKTVDLTLYDNLGQYLWSRHLEPVAQRQLITLVIGEGKLPNGVYSLKINAGTEKKAIQLVISRN